MSKQEDYASDSDESDEDFCPDKANNSDAPSEEESDDPISDNEDEAVSKGSKSKTKKKPTRKPETKPTTAAVLEEHVVTTRNRVETSNKKSSKEKDELESDEEDSSRKEALWADFLSDIPTATPSKPNKAKPVNNGRSSVEKKPSLTAREIEKKEPEKVVVKEIFEFAGEEVVVEKTVSLKDNGSKEEIAPSGTQRGSLKRPERGGLGSILNQIGKKKKISVLEKTKIDWDNFKTTEGIDEDLQTFNKGKDGYLQRQDFLERTDLRQFEIEKSVRESRRKPM